MIDTIRSAALQTNRQTERIKIQCKVKYKVEIK